MTNIERAIRRAEDDAVWGLGRVMWTSDTVETAAREQVKRDLLKWIEVRRARRVKEGKGNRVGQKVKVRP